MGAVATPMSLSVVLFFAAFLVGAQATHLRRQAHVQAAAAADRSLLLHGQTLLSMREQASYWRGAEDDHLEQCTPPWWMQSLDYRQRLDKEKEWSDEGALVHSDDVCAGKRSHNQRGERICGFALFADPKKRPAVQKPISGDAGLVDDTPTQHEIDDYEEQMLQQQYLQMHATAGRSKEQHQHWESWARTQEAKPQAHTKVIHDEEEHSEWHFQSGATSLTPIRAPSQQDAAASSASAELPAFDQSQIALVDLSHQMDAAGVSRTPPLSWSQLTDEAGWMGDRLLSVGKQYLLKAQQDVFGRPVQAKCDEVVPFDCIIPNHLGMHYRNTDSRFHNISTFGVISVAHLDSGESGSDLWDRCQHYNALHKGVREGKPAAAYSSLDVYNVWVALGERKHVNGKVHMGPVRGHPLALLDPAQHYAERTPGQDVASCSDYRGRVIQPFQGARWYYSPEMAYGQAWIFRGATHIPHTSVVLETDATGREAPRESVEMRFACLRH